MVDLLEAAPRLLSFALVPFVLYTLARLASVYRPNTSSTNAIPHTLSLAVFLLGLLHPIASAFGLLGVCSSSAHTSARFLALEALLDASVKTCRACSPLNLSLVF